MRLGYCIRAKDRRSVRKKDNGEKVKNHEVEAMVNIYRGIILNQLKMM